MLRAARGALCDPVAHLDALSPLYIDLVAAGGGTRGTREGGRNMELLAKSHGIARFATGGSAGDGG